MSAMAAKGMRMKLYLSVDLEGVTGVTAWEDVRKGTADHSYFRQQMTMEVNAICETALKNGVKEVLVKDAHATARNLLMDQVPRGVKLFSGWARDPFIMMSGLDKSFDAVMFSGYHAGAYYNDNPLAHTMSSESIFYFKINGQYISEFVLNAYIAAYHGVPVIGIVGDEGICRQAQEYIPNIVTMPVKKGSGNGVISLGRDEALDLIRLGTEKAMDLDYSQCLLKLPQHFQCELCYRNHVLAHRASFYKGVQLLDPHTVAWESDDFYEVLRTYFFI